MKDVFYASGYGLIAVFFFWCGYQLDGLPYQESPLLRKTITYLLWSMLGSGVAATFAAVFSLLSYLIYRPFD